MTTRTVQFRIYRYDPDKDAKPWMQDISLELEETDRKLLDAIVKLAERHIGSAEELIVAQREHPIGADVPVELVREGRPLVVTAKLLSD